MIVTKQMTNKKLGMAKLQLAFWCNWLWKVLRLCDILFQACKICKTCSL